MSGKKRKKHDYQRPEFYLIALTILLWIAFLFKVFKQNTPPELPENNQEIKLYTKPPESFKLKKQHNAASKQSEEKQSKTNKVAIEALREALEKIKPTKNVIMRGQTLTLIQAIEPNKKANTGLIINQEKLEKINADYINALRN